MVGVSGGGGRVQFLSLREAYIPNLSFLRSLEPFEKFGVVGGGGGGGGVQTHFSDQP